MTVTASFPRQLRAFSRARTGLLTWRRRTECEVAHKFPDAMSADVPTCSLSICRNCRRSPPALSAGQFRSAPGTRAGPRPVDDGRLRGWRERGRDPVFEGGRRRRWRQDRRRIAHMGDATAVAAIPRKTGGRSDDTGRRQYHRKKPPHDRGPSRLGLPSCAGPNTCPRRRQDAVTGLCTGHGHQAGAARSAIYSALTPAARMTFAHFPV